MKNMAGAIGGFVFGMAGFLVAFKLLIIDNTSPSDELAPGMVVLASIVSGVLFAFVGRWMQRHLGNKASTKESG